ncbi:MAG: UDP-3-O-(3-hydroxymyristoyl)glucosamine N-acyltransferase [Acidobacteria bacterium]|nr:MAG: UDP-3-O-(3-hydroxymyristoyl)glucosamine N-acyltransferase [Acidobacteriota bacterium]
MKRTAQEIAEYVGGELRGNGMTILDSIASLQNAGPSDLSYAEEKFQDDVGRSRAGCVLLRLGEFRSKTIIAVPNPKLAFARAAAWLLAEDSDDAGIHPSATVAPTAKLGERVKIGANVVVEARASIGAGTVVEAGCYIGKNTAIGDHCTLYPRVVIYKDVRVGNRVIIHAGAVIGADGFGFVQDGAAHVKFPQIGKVIIEDDVEIGANTCIDRGSLETTIIRRGVKLDNLIQIAHNVEIGEHTVIAAQTGISGSSTLGSQCVIGGQVGIGEHARLDDKTIIGGQGGVLNGKHVRAGEILWGTPVRPLKEFLLQQAYLARLVKKRP